MLNAAKALAHIDRLLRLTAVACMLLIGSVAFGQGVELVGLDGENLSELELQQGSVEDYLTRLPQHDQTMAQTLTEARAAGQVLRYVAKLDVATGQASVGLARVGTEHAFAHIRLTDNIVQYTTERYHDNPLVVQGPGAGPAVTAAGVLADLLRVAASVGAQV